MLKSGYGLAFVVATVCSFGLHQAFYYGLASFHNYTVINALSGWQSSPLEHSYSDYQDIKAKSQQVVSYHPNNAEYWYLSAEVNEWGYVFGYETQESALLEIKQQYIRATQLRSLWPDAWASLVKIKWRLQEFDQQMLDYFKKATTLGPQKPKVHLTVVELGLALYTSNHLMLVDIRPEFYRRLALGLRHPKTRTKVRQLITQYNAHALVCRWLINEDIKTKKLISKCR